MIFRMVSLNGVQIQVTPASRGRTLLITLRDLKDKTAGLAVILDKDLTTQLVAPLEEFSPDALHSAALAMRKETARWREFGRVVKKLCWSPVMLSALDKWHCGWNDGGCRILADAYLLWLGPRATRYVIVDRGVVQHVLVRVGDHYLDGDGASTASVLLHRWKKLEHLAAPQLLPDAATYLTSRAKGMPRSRSRSECLANVLGEHVRLAELLAELGQKPPSRVRNTETT